LLDDNLPTSRERKQLPASITGTVIVLMKMNAHYVTEHHLLFEDSVTATALAEDSTEGCAPVYRLHLYLK